MWERFLNEALRRWKGDATISVAKWSVFERSRIPFTGISIYHNVLKITFGTNHFGSRNHGCNSKPAPLKARAQKSIPEFGGAENLRQETKEKLHPSLASNKQFNEAAEGRRGGEKRAVRKRLAQRFC